MAQPCLNPYGTKQTCLVFLDMRYSDTLINLELQTTPATHTLQWMKATIIK